MAATRSVHARPRVRRKRVVLWTGLILLIVLVTAAPMVVSYAIDRSWNRAVALSESLTATGRWEVDESVDPCSLNDPQAIITLQYTAQSIDQDRAALAQRLEHEGWREIPDPNGSGGTFFRTPDRLDRVYLDSDRNQLTIKATDICAAF